VESRPSISDYKFTPKSYNYACDDLPENHITSKPFCPPSKILSVTPEQNWLLKEIAQSYNVSVKDISGPSNMNKDGIPVEKELRIILSFGEFATREAGQVTMANFWVDYKTANSKIIVSNLKSEKEKY